MTVLEQLKAPFPADAVSWRPMSTNKKKFEAKQADKRKGLPAAYLDARDVTGRLDDVMGVDWQCEYVSMQNGTCCCRIGLLIDGQWRWRSDGAGETDVEGDKGQYSAAFKRAAVKWGVGAYLYEVKARWIDLDDYWGIPDAAMSQLRALLVRGGAAPSSPPLSQPPPQDTPASTRAAPPSPPPSRAALQKSQEPLDTAPTQAETADSRVAALAKVEKNTARSRESEALLKLLSLSLEYCADLDMYTAWVDENGSKSGKQDALLTSHKAELQRLCRAKWADLNKEMAA